jgi:hypothetical protein
VQRYDAAGVKEGAPVRLDVSEGQQIQPDVAMDAQGNYAVVWRSLAPGGTEWRTFVQRFDTTGNAMGELVVVDRLKSVAFGEGAAIATTPGGGSIVTWMGNAPDAPLGSQTYFLFAQRLDAVGGKVGDVIRVSDVNVNFPHQPDVGVDAAGNFVIAWRDQVGQRVVGLMQRFNAAGVKQGGPVVVGDVVSDYTGPNLAMAPDGTFVVVWDYFNINNDPNNTQEDVYARRYNAAGVSQGSAFVVGSRAGRQFGPAAAADAQGNFIVAWTNEVNSNADVAAQRFLVDHAPAATGTLADVSVGPDAPDTSVDLKPAFQDDRDADDALVYSVTGNTNPALFTSASLAGGVLTLDYAPAATGTSAVTVRATDRSGLFTERTFNVTVGARPAVVTGMFLNGTTWSPAFRQALAAGGVGDAAFGYLVTDPARLADLPWSNVNQVSLRFDRPVTLDDQSLAVERLGTGSYKVINYQYDAATRTATWTLARPLANDRPRVVLGGGEIVPPAAPFQRRLAMLVGDVNGDGRVNALDLGEVKRRLNSRADPVVGSGYSVFADADGSGRINALDLGAVRANMNATLPPQPAPTPALAAASRPRSLFGTQPILPA